MLVGLAVCCGFAAPLLAGGVTVLDPWVQAQPPAIQTLQAYMVIRNTSRLPQTLVAVDSPLFDKVELHATVRHGAKVTMRTLDGWTVKGGQHRYLRAGGDHLMLIAPRYTRPLRGGTWVPLTLHFKDGTRLSVEAVVREVPGRVRLR